METVKFYAVHEGTSGIPPVVYSSPAKALLAFVVINHRDGIFGQTKGIGVGNGALPLFKRIEHIVPGKIATGLEFISPSTYTLSEYTKSSQQVLNQSYEDLAMMLPTKAITRKADSTMDANGTLLAYQLIIRTAHLNPNDPAIQIYKVDSFSTVGVEKSLLETARYDINWEILSLSLVAFVSIGSSFEKIERDIPAVFGTFLTNKPVQQAMLTQPPKAVFQPPKTFVPPIAFQTGGPLLPRAQPSVVQSKLTPMGGQQVQCNIVVGKGPLAQIICGQLAMGPTWKDVIDTNRCTVKGYKIAESLIKVAATRIFSIPEQSIMEPVVNSLDAYNPARKIGKFGMGFFSLMYWVVKEPKATLTIDSTYTEANFTKPCGYQAIISNQNGELYVDVKELNTTPVTGTGFSVRLDFGANLDDETYNRFAQQLDRLRYVTSALIVVNAKFVLNSDAITKRIETENYAKPKEIISVILNRYEFKVEDKATGLSIEKFYSTLIVPSISSKTISLSNTKEVNFVDRSRLYLKRIDGSEGEYNSFKVTVGDIVVVDIKFSTDFDDNREYYTVLMTLPLHTKVPVSRDDVLLASVLNEAKMAMSYLLKSDLDQLQDTVYVEQGLMAFANETASTENLEIIKAFLDTIPQELRKRNLIGVSVYRTVYIELDADRPLSAKRYISTLNYDQSWLEEQLRLQETSYDTFFLNKRVIFTKLPQGTLAVNGGTSSFIFVNVNYPKDSGQGDRWPASLATQHKRDILYPVGTKFGENLSKAVLQYTDTFDDARSKLLMETLAGKYQSALDLREPESGTTQNYLSVQIPLMIQYFKAMYHSFYPPEDFQSIIGSIITALDNIEPAVASYGETLKIRCVNTDSALDLIMNSQITLVRLINGKAAAFKDSLMNGNINIIKFVDEHRNLYAKASGFQVALVDRGVKLAIDRKYINFAQVVPFSASFEFNIVLEFIYATTMVKQGIGNRGSIFMHGFIELLRESTNVFQFVLGYLLMHVLFKKLSSKETGILKVSLEPSILLTRLQEVSETSPKELATKLSSVILSTITKEFGLYPANPTYVFYVLFMGGGIHELLEYPNIFDFYYPELYRPTIDVYTRMEKTANVNGLIQEIPRGIPEPNEIECYRFTLSKLVEFVFQQELPPTNLELFKAVNRFKSKVPARLQIIELAISAGTSKNALPSKLIELTQNAIDAVRSANHPEVKIANPTIAIIVKKLQGVNELLIGISDPVGIPPAGIVALSIPFLSGKQASEIVTGEIGSGFFNVYREATKVMIITTIDNITTELIDTPIVDPATNQIVDIDRCATVKKTTAPNGTQIFIQSRHSEIGLTDAAVEAISFTKETLGLISAGPIITLNNIPVNIPLTLIYQTEFFEFRMGTVNFESYIMTKGVPFAPLHKYITALGLFKEFTWILDQFKTSVSLNVKTGVFTPVQTRTKIGLTNQNTNLLIRAIIDATFYVILFKIEHKLIDDKEIDQYLQYYSSTSVINQVLPAGNHSALWAKAIKALTYGTQNNLPEADRHILLQSMSRLPNPFMAIDFSDNLVFTINQALIAAFEYFPDVMKIQKLLRNYVQAAGHSVDTFPGQTLFNLLYRWLMSKKPVPVEMVRVPMPVGSLPPNKKQPQAKPVLVAAPRYLKSLINPNHKSFIELWIKTYCRLAEQSIPNWPKGVPNIIIDLKRDSPYSGEYSPSTNTLTLYYEYMVYPKPKSGPDNLTKIIEMFSTTDDINNAVLTLETNNESWRKYFMPKGTIAHELEHYRSKDEHGKSSHGNVRMNLPYGGDKNRIFLLQHHDTMLSLVNFYAEVSRELRKM